MLVPSYKHFIHLEQFDSRLARTHPSYESVLFVWSQQRDAGGFWPTLP